MVRKKISVPSDYKQDIREEKDILDSYVKHVVSEKREEYEKFIKRIEETPSWVCSDVPSGLEDLKTLILPCIPAACHFGSNIKQPLTRVNTTFLTRSDERRNDADVRRSLMVTGEEPVLTADDDIFLCSLTTVIVYFDAAVLDAYVKEGGQALELPEGSVRCYKRMNGLWHVAFDSNGGTIHYDLTEQESRLMNRLEGNEAEFNEAKVRLFKEHVARDEANAIVRNLQYDSVGLFPSYASKDDVPNNISEFAGQHVQLILKLMTALSHNSGNGFNREFEVGGRRNRWDDIDDERRFKGGLSM